MRRRCPASPAPRSVAALVGSLLAVLPVATGTEWPGFRGHGDSVTTARDLPLHWSATHNLAWRIPLAGTGQSSPVLWESSVYLTCAEGPRKEELVVLALEAVSGKTLWRHSRTSSQPEEVSDTRSQAAPTPVAGPEGVYALFESGDCLALDHAGRLRWHRSLAREVGEFSSNHGLGGSPALAPGMLVIPLDQERPSCLLAVDRDTGVTRWKTPRPGRTAWSSALFVDDPQTPQIVVSGGGTVASYRADSGQPIWELTGFMKNLVPSPTLRSSLLVIGAGSKGSNVAFDWKGSTLAPVERWRADNVSSGFASPLIHRGRVYFMGTAGVLYCHEAGSGKSLFEERLPQGTWASPVGADDRIYVFGDRGVTTVLAAEDRFRPLATNVLDLTKKLVGVAVADRAVYLRSQGEMARIGAGIPSIP